MCATTRARELTCTGAPSSGSAKVDLDEHARTPADADTAANGRATSSRADVMCIRVRGCAPPGLACGDISSYGGGSMDSDERDDTAAGTDNGTLVSAESGSS
eukprot:12175463-Alexandrium_andersonii.AAC.1